MVYNCSHPFGSYIDFNSYLAFLGIFFALFLFVFYKSYIWQKSLGITFLGLSFLTLGGGYNLFNRYLHGCVADPFPFFGLFSFNLADLFVTGGLLLLSTLYIMKYPTTKKDETI